MKLAKRMSRLGTETAFEALAAARALEAEGKSIIHLGIGEPDFDTPIHIREAAKSALDDGYTHYTPSPGLMDVREAVALHQSNSQGYPVSPENIVITPGGKPVMFFTILALIENQSLLLPTFVGGVNQLIGSLRLVVVKDYIFHSMIMVRQKVDEGQKDLLTKTMVGLLPGSFV